MTKYYFFIDVSVQTPVSLLQINVPGTLGVFTVILDKVYIKPGI
jgi:hypothetical protein